MLVATGETTACPTISWADKTTMKNVITWHRHPWNVWFGVDKYLLHSPVSRSICTNKIYNKHSQTFHRLRTSNKNRRQWEEHCERLHVTMNILWIYTWRVRWTGWNHDLYCILFDSDGCCFGVFLLRLLILLPWLSNDAAADLGLKQLNIHSWKCSSSWQYFIPNKFHNYTTTL